MRLALVLLLVVSTSFLNNDLAFAGSISGGTYVDMNPGDLVDLTAEGTLDWIKFGNGENQTNSFFVVTKIGNPAFVPAVLNVFGDPDVDYLAVTGFSVLNFNWTNGNFGMYNTTGPVDTVVTETLNPLSTPYPIGLGASFAAEASAAARQMRVYVQGFDADVRITASMSGGGSISVDVSPTHNPPSDPGNNYSLGYYQFDYAGTGEIVDVSIETIAYAGGNQVAFANAGFFAATLIAIPEPSTACLALLGLVGVAGVGLRRRSRRSE